MKAIAEVAAITSNGGGVMIVIDAAAGSPVWETVIEETQWRYSMSTRYFARTRRGARKSQGYKGRKSKRSEGEGHGQSCIRRAKGDVATVIQVTCRGGCRWRWSESSDWSEIPPPLILLSIFRSFLGCLAP